MAMELIKGERAIQALKRGAKRLNDGGGLYLLPFTGGDAHYWRLDYTHEGRRKPLTQHLATVYDACKWINEFRHPGSISGQRQQSAMLLGMLSGCWQSVAIAC